MSFLCLGVLICCVRISDFTAANNSHISSVLASNLFNYISLNLSSIGSGITKLDTSFIAR